MSAMTVDHRDPVREAIRAWHRTKEVARSFVPGESPVPVSGKVVGEPESLAMMEAALDGWLTCGRFNEAFEQRLAEFIGLPHAMTVNSGSSANLIAMSSLFSTMLGDAAIRAGDEVITVAAGFPTTVNPILQNGAVPVFVDIRPDTYNIDVSQLEVALSTKTRAVMLAHTLGNPFDLAAVVDFCACHNLWLIEDCCDALGSRYSLPEGVAGWLPCVPSLEHPARWRREPEAARTRHVGTFGHFATLSFYPAHHITMGEGGAVLTGDTVLRRIAESIRDWGRDCWCPTGCDNTCGKRFGWQLGDLPAGYDHKYSYSHLGYNLKITDMQAACAFAQMDRLPGFVEARQRNFAFLSERLGTCAEHLELPRATSGSEPSWFGFPITLKPDSGVNRVDLLNYLDQHKIGTRLLFGGNLTRQPYFKGRNFRVACPLNVTDRVMSDTFWIGVWPGLDEARLNYLAERIEVFFGVKFD